MNKNKMKKLIINKKTINALLGAFVLSETIQVADNLINYELPPTLSKGIEKTIEENGTSIDDVEQFKNIVELTIDAKTTNINNLKYFKNLKRLTIENYDLLDNMDKMYINHMPKLNEVTFPVDYETIRKNKDFLWLSNCQKINIVANSNKGNDLQDLELYNLFNDLVKDNENINVNYFTQERLVELVNWDEKINEVVKELNFSENMTDEEKIINLVDYVTEYYQYDELIKEKENYEQISVENKENYYNNNLIKNFAEGNKYAISSNYAALLSLLGRYTGVKLDYVTGKFGLDSNYAWCEYRGAIIDPTKLDEDIFYKNMKKELNASLEEQTNFQQKMYKDAIYDRIKKDNSESNYFFYEKEETKEEEKVKNIEYDDERINKNIINNNLKMISKLSLTMVALILMAQNLSKNNTKDKIKSRKKY